MNFEHTEIFLLNAWLEILIYERSKKLDSNG